MGPVVLELIEESYLINLAFASGDFLQLLGDVGLPRVEVDMAGVGRVDAFEQVGGGAVFGVTGLGLGLGIVEFFLL